MSVQTGAASLPIALDEICHEEQMVVWASEIMGDLCEWLDFNDYDDKLDAVVSIKRTIRSIVNVALEAQAAELARMKTAIAFFFEQHDADEPTQDGVAAAVDDLRAAFTQPPVDLLS